MASVPGIATPMPIFSPRLRLPEDEVDEDEVDEDDGELFCVAVLVGPGIPSGTVKELYLYQHKASLQI